MSGLKTREEMIQAWKERRYSTTEDKLSWKDSMADLLGQRDEMVIEFVRESLPMLLELNAAEFCRALKEQLK